MSQHYFSRRTFMQAAGITLATPLILTSGGHAVTNAMLKEPTVILDPLESDVTIRFHHIEPLLNSAQMPDVKAAWPFDEGYGYMFRDISGQDRNAYVTGHTWNTTESGLTTALHQAGRRGGAVYLNGERWLQVQNHETLYNTGQVTVSAWIKPDRPPADMAWRSIVQKMFDSLGYTLLLADQNNIRFAIRDNAHGDHSVDSAPNTVQQGRWVHVTGTADASTGQLRLYINGTLAGSVNGAAFTPGNAQDDLMIGRSSWMHEAFIGWIDEVVLFGRVLTPQDVRVLYIEGLPKLYIQTRETIDSERNVWTHFKGNHAIPHPLEDDTRFSLRFHGSFTSEQGQSPIEAGPAESMLAPGFFGGAFQAMPQSGYTPLVYPSPIASDQGTFEAWFIPIANADDPQRNARKTLFRAERTDGWLEVFTQDRRWQAVLHAGGQTYTLQSLPQNFAYEQLVHIGLTWDAGNFALYLNGVEVARSTAVPAVVFDQRIILGGPVDAPAHGLIDDVRISATVRTWGTVCPRGHIFTESSALDLMDTCAYEEAQALFLWCPGNNSGSWHYAVKSWENSNALYQSTLDGFCTLYHPDTYGHLSSIEAGVAFDTVHNGWAGIFVQGSEPQDVAFRGYSFAINPSTNQLRLSAHHANGQISSKILAYDFAMEAHKTYTLTLTSINDGVLRGYIDGNSIISLRTDNPFTQGHAGVFTENCSAYFDSIHFSALTPATAQSRFIQQRIFADGELAQERIGYDALKLSAFRWQKRYGLLPWHRTYKDPQPPGCPFSADDGVPVPNAPAFWRSEDSANTDIITVNGETLLIMRGNPRYANGHGASRLGIHRTDETHFDGLHFTDPAPNETDLDQAQLLRGNLDTAPSEMRDWEPRNVRFQVNDQGSAYIGDGKIVVFAREFRNYVSPYPWYHRLVYGIYDVVNGTWEQRDGQNVNWSSMDPAAQTNTFQGIDATPDITALRDPDTDQYTLFLFHHYRTAEDTPTTGITGLRFENGQIELHSDYPTHGSYTKPNGDVIYGERILFDNGIYYVHYNSDTDRIEGDWPDRYALAASLHPYTQPWINSADNNNPERPYFQRGGEFDCDNAALWGGQLFKYRGRYYMYYETFHAIEDVNAPYQHYDHLSTGSRVGYATAN